MPPAGATQGHGQVTLSFPNVMWNQIREQAFDAAQKFPRLWERTNVACYARILAAEGAQPRNEMRIGKKANVEDEIGVRGNPIPKAKTDDGNYHRPAVRILKTVNNELAEFVDIEFRGVNHDVGKPPDGCHPAALFTNALRHRRAVS